MFKVTFNYHKVPLKQSLTDKIDYTNLIQNLYK